MSLKKRGDKCLKQHRCFCLCTVMLMIEEADGWFCQGAQSIKEGERYLNMKPAQTGYALLHFERALCRFRSSLSKYERTLERYIALIKNNCMPQDSPPEDTLRDFEAFVLDVKCCQRAVSSTEGLVKKVNDNLLKRERRLDDLMGSVIWEFGRI